MNCEESLILRDILIEKLEHQVVKQDKYIDQLRKTIAERDILIEDLYDDIDPATRG